MSTVVWLTMAPVVNPGLMTSAKLMSSSCFFSLSAIWAAMARPSWVAWVSVGGPSTRCEMRGMIRGLRPGIRERATRRRTQKGSVD